MKNILLLGATGSIGTQVLDIIRNNPTDYKLIAFSFNKNLEKAKEIISEFKPLLVACPIKQNLKKLHGVITTPNLENVVIYPVENPYVINALVGSCGLIPTILAIKENRPLLLANKESLVMAGDLVNELKKEHKQVLIPIDSEHSALYQLLKMVNKEDVKAIYITASGGALRDYPLDLLGTAKKEEALSHPTWKMGQKITIDSATMMNKVFEIIEAYHLFGFPYDKIYAVLDRTSTIHAMVELNDGKVLIHKAKNDMHLPINYAMSYPNSVDYNESTIIYDNMDQVFSEYNLSNLDTLRYPVLNLVETILKGSKFNGAIVNAANEALVGKYLNDEILYKDIENGIKNALSLYNFDELEYNLENILFVNKQIIEEVSK